MKHLFLAFFLLSCFETTTVFACFNENQSLNSSGKFSLIDDNELSFYTNFDNGVINIKLNELGRRLKKKGSVNLLSDYALYLVRGGKTEEALAIYKVLEKRHPNNYVVVANLGTTYELMGDNKNALKYIKKGLQLNPASHHGSEWIHVRVLEAKLQLEKDPDLLEGKSLLELTEEQKKSKKVRQQILEQLKERFRFCAPPDEIMAALLIDLGDCYKTQLSFEHAKAIYQVAELYYQSGNRLLPKRIEECRNLRTHYADRQPMGAIHSETRDVYKVGGINYTSLLQTNANNPINWSLFETNPNTLLGYIGLSDPNAEKELNLPKQITKLKDPVLSGNHLLIGGIVVLIVLLAGMLYSSSGS